MAYALRSLEWKGTYLGIDILKRHIIWLQKNFSVIDPCFQFKHIDIRNDRYNPSGILDVKNLSFYNFIPDLVIIFSVFTHMFENEIEIYLSKLRQIINYHDGLIVATFFTLPTSPNLKYEFNFRLNDHCSYYNSDDPLHAIAYDREWLFDLLKKQGFVIKEFRPGFQDLFFLEKCKT